MSDKQGELIKIEQINGKGICSARELHSFLEVQSRFNDWVTNRIKEFDFQENVDFTKILVKVKDSGRPSTDYALTINMAKELSMVERNEKGKQARRYFIACESALKEKSFSLVPEVASMIEVLRKREAGLLKEVGRIRNSIKELRKQDRAICPHCYQVYSNRQALAQHANHCKFRLVEKGVQA